MTKCVYCGEPYDATQKSRTKCNSSQCQVWSHKQCCDIRQVSTSGFWYCKDHVNEIPSNLRRSNMQEESESEEVEEDSNDDNEKNVEHNKDANKVDQIKIPIIIPTDSDFQSIQIISDSHNVNDKIVQLNKEKPDTINPYDDGNDYNPFANFNCDTCGLKFTQVARGVFCLSCRNTFHINCLNEQELREVKNNNFLCQHCIQNQIRLENLKERQRKEMKSKNDEVTTKCKTNQIDNNKSKKKSKGLISSTPNSVHFKGNKKVSSSKNKIVKYFSSSSDSSSSLSSDNDSDDKSNCVKKYKKYKKLYKKHKLSSKNKIECNSSSSSESGSDDDVEITHDDAMVSLYKFTQEERSKSRYEKLPVVDSVDTKWQVFYDLFKKSRKLFSDSENVLRIQKSIKSKEILDIGGISLFDPRTHWQALKLINERLSHSYNLLQKETNEIIKMKKIRYDSENKKIIEFINKIINCSHIVERYGTKKHKSDDRVLSHISNIMPYSMLNGWHKMKTKLEDKNRTVYIKHVSEYLSNQVALITSKMHAEDLDPWKDENPKLYKKNDNSRKSYNTHIANNDNDASYDYKNNYCWFHKSKGHSSFSCSKLWAMSGKEVSDLARKNDICTFCGLKKHKDCQAARLMNCKIENCTFKHHILFCYKRKGSIDNESDTKNENAEEPERFPKQKENSMLHQKDDHKEDESSEYDEVEIPQQNFYINQPPKSIKIPKISQTKK